MLTALVPTHNSETTIRRCLDSLDWVDQLFIVDSFSTDGTLTICQEYTDWIVQHEYLNSAAQKNWALLQIQSDWVLQVDSDEWIEPALAEDIQVLLKQDAKTDGYRMARKNLLWGQWVRSCGLYPDWQTRLFKVGKGRWEEREVHAHVIGLQTVGTLNNHIVHTDLADLPTELTQLGSQMIVWEANELVKKGKSWRWWDVTLRPLAIFLLVYLWRAGYRDGFRGLFRSVYYGYYSFMTYSRLYELELRQGKRK